MFGIRLIFLLAVLGGVIAFIADKLGSKIGKKKLRVFGLRPHDTSVLLTVLSGVLISLFSMGILAVSSESARTALFGMEKLQKELQQLNTEKGTVEEEYNKAMASLQQKNEAIASLDQKIKESNAAQAAAEKSLQQANENLSAVQGQYQETQGALVTARSEVQSLTEARDKLNAEIDSLKQETKDLQQGLAVMRGGQMMYRSGEIVFAGVLQGGMPEEENMKQINWMLDGANTAAMNRIGLDSSSKAEMVWLTRDEVERLKDLLGKAKGNVLVRVRSVANTVVGQPVLCGMEVIPNRVIFKDGKKIHEKVIDLADKTTNADQALMTFLQEINERSVKEGVLPDPMTGKVGNINAVTVVDTVTKMQKMGGKIRLTGYADGEITTAGPVQLRLGIEKAADQP
ncbi:MAG: DUF3084 domain-containing protein [Acidaminococcaceae bacterium]|nr:DUF3084 domain-containing protein [Acidaminococcaceae bacterium]MBQ9319763.1 DUF3084 domain-containing protein [Acidaminococcaceae bacterium]